MSNTTNTSRVTAFRQAARQNAHRFPGEVWAAYHHGAARKCEMIAEAAASMQSSERRDTDAARFERSLALMLAGWLEYADAHQAAYESSIREDGVLGDYWEAIGDALHGLLDGERGRFDGGLVSSLIVAERGDPDAEGAAS